MIVLGRLTALVGFGLCIAIASQVSAQEAPGRKEVRRADLSGAPGMEVILSVHEWHPGDELVMHVHHGIEAGYFLEGGTVQAPGQQPRTIAAGAPIWNLRDAPHAGFKVIGDKTIKLVTVHVVDKGKPLYESVQK